MLESRKEQTLTSRKKIHTLCGNTNTIEQKALSQKHLKLLIFSWKVIIA